MSDAVIEPRSHEAPGARRSAEAGFTLLELLVALAIVAILALAQAAPFQATISSRERAEAAMQRSTAARLTLQRLAEELTGAVPLTDETLRFNLVDRTFDRPASDISFTTSAARRVSAGAQDPFEVVRYHLEPGPPDSQGGVLVKDQLPSVAAPGTLPTSNVILEDVASFTASVFLDATADPQPTWQGGTNNVKLPRAVDLQLALADGTASPQIYRLLVDLPMGGLQRSGTPAGGTVPSP